MQSHLDKKAWDSVKPETIQKCFIWFDVVSKQKMKVKTVG